MTFSIVALFVGLGFFATLIVAIEVGRWAGRRVQNEDPERFGKGVAPMEGAVFALLGLLIAFTFSGAAVRFEARRHLIGNETNDIGTAYLRIDVLPAGAQPEMRRMFADYVDTRIATFKTADLPETQTHYAESQAFQLQIWSLATKSCASADAPPYCAMLLLPALNSMFDIATTRTVAVQNHPPYIIFVLLAILCLLAALLVGYDMSVAPRRNWLHTLLFAGVLWMAVQVIVDLEFPRRGFIRIDDADKVLIDLRAGMK